VRLSIAVRRVWLQYSRLTLLHIVSVLVPPCVAGVDCALCRQLNNGTLLLLAPSGNSKIAGRSSAVGARYKR